MAELVTATRPHTVTLTWSFSNFKDSCNVIIIGSIWTHAIRYREYARL